MGNGMRVFDAIQEMRRLSKQGTPFSFTYMSYTASTGTSDGVKQVNRAVLRKAADGNQEHLPYFDLDAQQNRQCHQALLMSFNNQNVVLE